MKEIKIFITGDGSHSLLNEELNETYHSRHGAVKESQYVFIEQGFNYLIEKHHSKALSVLEVGFGTGLNALLTLREAIKNNIDVAYTTLEIRPLPPEIWMTLNYPDPDHLFKELHSAVWQKPVQVHSNLILLKLEKSLQTVELAPQQFDLIYFDAFAPNKQPEMWERQVLERVVSRIKTEGAFVTYCAKGQLKRDLKALGLIVESLPGPPGKREMVRAVKP